MHGNHNVVTNVNVVFPNTTKARLSFPFQDVSHISEDVKKEVIEEVKNGGMESGVHKLIFFFFYNGNEALVWSGRI